MANKAYKYRIYPTAEQQILFEKTFGCCRFVYNQILSYREERYKGEGKSVSKIECNNYCNRELKNQYEWLREVDCYALVNAVFNVDAAYRSFFKKQGGYPRFKSKHRSRRSYTTNISGHNIRVMENSVRLPKAGMVKAKIHRQAPEGWAVKAATVSQDGDGKYYCSVLYEYEAEVKPVAVHEEKVIGMDYKTSCLYADSNGDFANMPKYYKQSSERLAKKQRKLKHKTIGSQNYRKAQQRIAKLQKHTANQRKDFLHKKSAEIANQYDMVCIEDISIKEQMQSRKFRAFHRSTLDNGWNMFTVLLAYKLADRGKRLVKVDKGYPSSQICSDCGAVNPALSDDRVRKWTCPVCGAIHNRDINAAKNIKNEGYRLYIAA